MLKKRNLHLFILKFESILNFLVNQRYVPIFLRLLTPLFFWINIQPSLLLFKITKNFFFFKFLRVKHTYKKYLKKKFKKTVRKPKSRKKSSFTKKTKRSVRWTYLRFVKKNIITHKRLRRLFNKINFKRWYRNVFKIRRKYELSIDFNRLLKKKIQRCQMFAGMILFRSNKKNILNKLFGIFTKYCNNSITAPELMNRFYMLTFYIRFNKKYKNFFVFSKLHSYNNWKIVHTTLIKTIFFNKLRLTKHRLFRLARRLNKLRSLRERKRLKKVKWLRSRRYLWQRAKFRKFYIRSLITHRDRMTSLSFHDLSSLRLHFYYMNLLLNLWNIRSYNWKQIT